VCVSVCNRMGVGVGSSPNTFYNNAVGGSGVVGSTHGYGVHLVSLPRHRRSITAHPMHTVHTVCIKRVVPSLLPELHNVVCCIM